MSLYGALRRVVLVIDVAMLAELRVENLLLIERAELRLDPGLNVITGETGAGKTVLAHALDLLLGGKPRPGIVRPGTSEAYVEGVFERAALDQGPELAELRERLSVDADEIVVARRVTAEGRTRAYLQGRSASAADLAAVGSSLLSFYGQHEHRKLTLSSVQLDVLDAFCGEAHLERRRAFQRSWAHTSRLHAELQEATARAGARERDLDLLEFELREIDSTAPGETEEAELEAERRRLQGVEALREATWAAASALDPEGEEQPVGALGLLSRAAAQLSEASELDERLEPIAERCNALSYEAQDLARELHGYAGSLEADPARLAQVEDRLDLFTRLKRKHGGTIQAVLEHAERCRLEHERLSNAEETSARLREELERGTGELELLSSKLQSTREEAASRLETAVREELEQLAMSDASFEVVLRERPGAPAGGPLEHLGPSGADVVEFVIAPNRGVPAGPLRAIASGGELSRVMLALMTVATARGDAPTVIFDEIDAGVGGRTARVLGERLRALAARRQVVCITHLPQVASLAQRHFAVTKDPGDGSTPAHAAVEQLDEPQLVGELCRMLGADEADGVARRHAERLLRAA
jgi:DNA repair protein RecN (Recombination protein N)